MSKMTRKALIKSRWKPSLETVRTVYDGVPDKSILRRLCSLCLTASLRKFIYDIDYGIWETVKIIKTSLAGSAKKFIYAHSLTVLLSWL